MKTVSTERIYISFNRYLDINVERDCPFAPVLESCEEELIKKLFPPGKNFFIEKDHFNKLISYLKKYLNRFNTHLLCYLYCANEDFSISKRKIYNLFEEKPIRRISDIRLFNVQAKGIF